MRTAARKAIAVSTAAIQYPRSEYPGASAGRRLVASPVARRAAITNRLQWKPTFTPAPRPSRMLSFIAPPSSDSHRAVYPHRRRRYRCGDRRVGAPLARNTRSRDDVDAGRGHPADRVGRGLGGDAGHCILEHPGTEATPHRIQRGLDHTEVGGQAHEVDGLDPVPG